MNPDLRNAIAPLLQALEEYERHHREAITNSYHTPYSMSSFVPVDANDLRRLRDAVAASGVAIERATEDSVGVAIGGQWFDV